MEGVKQKITKTWSRVSQKALKGAKEGGWKFCLEEFWQFIIFVILKMRFSNHGLIKINMIYVHITPEVTKK